MCCHLGLTSSFTSLQKYTQPFSCSGIWLDRQFSRISTCSSTNSKSDIYINMDLCQKASAEVLRQRINVLHDHTLRHPYCASKFYRQQTSQPNDYISAIEFDFNMNYLLNSNLNPLLPPRLSPTMVTWKRKGTMQSYTSIVRLDLESNSEETKKNVEVLNTSKPIFRHQCHSNSNINRRACRHMPLRDVTQWYQLDLNENTTHSQNIDKPTGKYHLDGKEKLQLSTSDFKPKRILTKKLSAASKFNQSENNLIIPSREEKVHRKRLQKENKKRRPSLRSERREHYEPQLKHSSIPDYTDYKSVCDSHVKTGRAKAIPKTSRRSKSSNSILNSYSIHGLIGIGGGGAVYNGVRIVDQMPVAIKQIKRDKVKRWETIYGRTVPQEIALMIRACSHRNVVRLLDWYEFLDSFILVLEKPKHSVDLFDYIREVGKIWEKDACLIFKQIVLGVQYIHSRGVVHRDIKDENIVLNRNTFETKLIDFGCGTLLHDEYYKDFAGTPEFYPPEWFNEGQYKARSATVWSLGVLLFDMVCGEFPFRSTRKIAQGNFDLKRNLSEDVKDLISWMMTKDPQARPSIHQILNHPWLRERNTNL